MKVYCYNCGEPVPYKLTTRFRRVTCGHCHRLVFREVRFVGTIWLCISVVCAILVAVSMFRLADTVIRRLWGGYLVLVSPYITVALLSPLSNIVVLLAYKLKYPQSRL